MPTALTFANFIAWLNAQTGADWTGVFNWSDAPGLAPGTMTPGAAARSNRTLHQFSWTNAMIVALGANLTGDIAICTLPAKTVVTNIWVRRTGQATGPTTLTGSIGVVSAAYDDYLDPIDLMAAVGTNGFDGGGAGRAFDQPSLPSVAGTTVVKMHLIATDVAANTLADVLACAGEVFIETVQLP